jgi:hypothetical protein
MQQTVEMRPQKTVVGKRAMRAERYVDGGGPLPNATSVSAEDEQRL